MDIKTILGNIQLSKDFTALEFANSLDGYALKLPNIGLVNKLQSLRDLVGPIKITSGFRTETFNKSVKGSSNSYHLDGLAVDCLFSFQKYTKVQLVAFFKAIGFTNVNFYFNKDKSINRVHLDVGASRTKEKYNYRDIML